MTIKAGTRIEVKGFGIDNLPVWEGAKIARIRPCMLPMPAGYHPVIFDADSADFLVHESRFRVIDNRATGA